MNDRMMMNEESMGKVITNFAAENANLKVLVEQLKYKNKKLENQLSENEEEQDELE